MLSFIFHHSLAMSSTLIVLYFPPKIFLIPLELVKKIAKNRQKICKIWLGGPHFWILGGPPKYESDTLETTTCVFEDLRKVFMTDKKFFLVWLHLKVI